MTVVRLAQFLLLSLVYWVIGAVFILITILPCGMGPDADCDMASGTTIWLAVIGVVLIYAALCFFLLARWKTK
jgi:hypothetical protein